MISLKQPSETIRVSAPINGFVRSATIASIVARSGGPADALTATVTIVSGTALCAIAGGVADESYLVSIDAELTNDEVRQAEIEISVMETDWTMPDGGVAYLTIAEFVDRVGQAEAILMTDIQGNGRIDRDRLVSELRAAQGLIDGYCGARYPVPLSSAPEIIKTALTDIARGRLYPRGAPEGVAGQAAAAIKLLERIAAGTLPLKLADGAPAPADTTAAPIVFTTGGRRYPRGRGRFFP